MANGHEPIDDDELLYRRVPMSWYSVVTGLHSSAFGPNRVHDSTGISLSRAKYKTAEQAAVSPSRPDKSYYVAVLRAGDVRQAGMNIVPRPTAGNPSHCECTDLRADNYRDTETLERQARLVELCLRVEGPFPPPPVKP